MADVVLIATADWDHPLWTNKQHVACSLVSEGHRVLYVESLGLRTAQPSGRDLRRILRRLRSGLRLPRQVRRHLWVWSPLVLPGGSSGLARLLNQFSLGLGLELAFLITGFRRPWLWTYNPLTARLLNLSRYSMGIYHCVDAVQEQPCMPRVLITAEEQRLCGLVDQVFVTSPQLQRQLAPYARSIRYDPNVADQDHFAEAMQCADEDLPADLAALAVPRVGFIGAVSSYKLDFALIVAVAKALPQVQFVFVGPVGEGEPHTDISSLAHQPNVHLLGHRDYGDLPRYCAGISCGWLPLQLNPYTQAMFPMKFFEYLAAGLPVIASRIDALQAFADVAWLCEPTAPAFTAAISGCLAGKGPTLQQRLALVAEHTYTARTRRMLAALPMASPQV